ncbi:MAG: TIGR01777 family oxidoreductase [Thermoanaerobaculia bacterium]
MRIVVTGGTGFIGRALVARLRADGHDVMVPGRGDTSGVEGAGAIVNLAGEPIAQRWTDAARHRIEESRTDGTRRLVRAIAAGKARPSVLVSASAVGYYGARGDGELDEEASPGDDFLARLCVRWEDAAGAAESVGVRVVRIRTGLVLGPDGGALAKMLPAYRAFAGGPVGTGRQWMSWIHRDDLVSLFLFVLGNAAVSGVLNGAAPTPVRNRDFARALGLALHRPAVVPAPAAALRLLFGEMATILLDGQRVVPRRALALGFSFRYPDLPSALAAALGGGRERPNPV